MKPSTIPLICGFSLAAMSAAALSHWWSVRQFIAAVDAGVPVIAVPAMPPKPAATPAPTTRPAPVLATTRSSPAPVATAAAAPDAHQKDFYEALIAKMANLQTQNHDLLDQLAETNRDLMKLEFRVDTHSESFRPLPVSEDQPATSMETGPGVLPPRAEPVALPEHE